MRQNNPKRFSRYSRLVGSIAVPIAIAILLVLPMLATAGSPVCVGNFCSVTDTTVQDFAAGQFYLTSLRKSGDGEVQLLPIGISSAWVTDSHPLPLALSELSAVIYQDIIFVIGGFDQNGIPQTSIYTATATFNGSLAAGWQPADTLPSPRASGTAVVSPTASGGFLYILGGTTDGTTAGYTSTILYRALSSNGTLTGAWQSATMPPIGTTGKLVYLQAVAHGGFLYVLGGQDRFFNRYSDIYRAAIDSSGSLGTWTLEASSIPDVAGSAGRASFMAVVGPNSGGTDYLYIVGGHAGNLSDPPNVSTVDFAQFSITGSLSTFSSSQPLAPLADHAGVQQGGQVLVTGGRQGANASSSQTISGVNSALIDANNGSLIDLGSGGWRASSPLPQARAYHAVVASTGGSVYVLGGNSLAGGPQDTVFRGTFGGAGTVYPPAGSLTSKIIDFGATYHLDTLASNTDITAGGSESLTVQYRAASSAAALLAQPWSPAGSNTPGTGITNTYTFGNQSARFFQYRALFTTTAPYTRSPILNLVDLRYSLTGPDLQVVQSDGANTAHIGDILTYTIAYTNSDSRTAPGSVLTMTPPISTIVIGGPGWVTSGSVYKRNLGSLAPHASGSTFFVVQVAGKPASGIINSVLQVGYDNSLGNDPNPVDNVSIDSDSIAVVDLTISTSDFKTNAVISATNTYSVSFANTGQLNATNVVITDTIPAGARYVGGPAWTRVSDTVWVHQAGTVAAGTGGSVDFTLFISGTLIPNTPFVNSVRIADDQTHGLDGDASNNIFADTDNLVGNGPDVIVTSATGRYVVGGPSTITFTIANIGNVDTGWFWTDIYSDRAPSDITVLGDTYVTVGDLAFGTTRTLTAALTFVSSGPHSIYIQADTCPQGICAHPGLGSVIEVNETNNLFGPLILSNVWKLFLPLIRR